MHSNCMPKKKIIQYVVPINTNIQIYMLDENSKK